MAKANRENLPRVNFFDGQRVTEADLDAEQVHHRDLVSNLTRDFHGSGVVRDRVFESRVLLDTSNPSGNLDSSDDENSSEFVINSGNYDGMAISLDRQPSDSVYGNRVEVQADSLAVGGRVRAKVLIVGTTYSSLTDSGELVVEVLEFGQNTTKVTEHYYTRIISVLFNNFSGGVGRTEYSASLDSENTALTSGRFIFRESEPLKVFSRTKTSFQTESPNVALASFITSSTEVSIEDEIKAGLGSIYNYNDLYVELEPEEEIYFKADGNSTVQYGQKFLAKSNNIQKVDLLMSVAKDEDADIGSEYDFSGDIVISIHRLSADINCITDPNPDNLIDFDPEQSPLIEMSYSQEDLEALGYKLGADPQVVSFDFSGTLIADPTIEPSIDVDEFYAILISRRGDNRTGTLAMQKGYDRPSRKTDNGQPLNVLERFGKQTSRFVEFDPNNLVYVDDSDSSLWFVVHSDTVEVTDGIAYADDGISVILAKTEEYVGSTEVSSFLRNISLGDVSEGASNLLVLQRQASFAAPSTHPRTGNFVNTRILDTPVVSVMSSAEWANADGDHPPVLLARVKDFNVRDAQDISGTFDRPGYTDTDEIIFINPSTELLTSNLINRIITPDLDCSCASRYRIISADCEMAYAGDLDGDKELTSNDIGELLNVVGNTVNSETTERKVLGGELDPVSFFKSDLNDDGTVDGTDIELLEDAIDGYSNFTIPESFNILRLKLENVLKESDYPEVLNTTLFSEGVDPETSTNSFDDTVSFTTETENQALSIRVGDNVNIFSESPPESSDVGLYIVSSKTVDDTGLGVVLAVTQVDGSEAGFVGSSDFAISIISGTKVNTFADNNKLLDVPYDKKTWSISYVGAPHSEDFVDVCDLRRYTETNFIEEFEESCVFDDESCVEKDLCTPQYKNQKVLADDLFIPNGEIYKEPGVPYHGDIEYATITLPLPPGSIDDCSVDLYTSFIKSDGGSQKTAAGYPAMTFSDGTYVGCEDAGGETDITKGRVKISQCISSLYVDAFVDGYAVDGYADESASAESTEAISEEFTDYTYPSSSGFSDWGTSFSGDIAVDTGTPPGWNVPTDFTMTTIDVAEERIGTLAYPGSIDEVAGDFIIDFTMSRATWVDSDLTFGNIGFFATLTILNDSTTTKLKFGWRQSAYNATELFYSGTIENTLTELLISDFDYAIEAPDAVGEELRFRLRRIDDAVFAMYYNDFSIDSSENITGQLIRLGELPDMQPGTGPASVDFNIAQYNNPQYGKSYAAKLHDVAIKSNYNAHSDIEEESILISRDADSLMSRATVTFPIMLTQRTNIVSATMIMTAAGEISSTDSFNIIPYDILNADNLGTIIDYPLEDNDSFVVSFSPGTVVTGESIEVDITSLALYFLSQPGHLPGFYKALIVEPSTTAESSMLLSPDMEFVIEYEEVTTGVIFKVGVSLDASTGIASLQTKNILYDSLNEANRTVLKFGVHLKKSGFKNDDLTVGIKDLERIGIGTCVDEAEFVEGELCYFVAGSTATGIFVEGPFPCAFHLP